MPVEVVRPYSEVFHHIRRDVVEATKELVKGGIWKQDVSEQDKVILMGLWIKKAAEIYGFETPTFHFITGVEGELGYLFTGGGSYNRETNTIYLFKKFSLTTLMHEFRHAMQSRMDISLYRDDFAEDARAWSMSLFETALPVSHCKAVERGIVHFA